MSDERRQVSLPEIVLDQMKSAIDNGDVEGAIAKLDEFIVWYGGVGTPLVDAGVHVSNWRAINTMEPRSSVFDETALEVLDVIWSRQLKAQAEA
jgi:hypothetical protein